MKKIIIKTSDGIQEIELPDDAVVKKIGFTPKNRTWKPKHGETVYFLSEIGTLNMVRFKNEGDFLELLSYGNCFKTKQDAFKFKEYIKNYKNTIKQ